MEEGFDWSKNPRPAEDGHDLEALDPEVVPDLGQGLDPDLEAAVTKAEDPNPGADLGLTHLRIGLALRAEPRDDLVRGLETAMMMRAKTEIAAILAKGLVRGLDPDLGLGPDPVLDLEVTRTKETKKFTTLPMRNNQQLIHEYFLWQFTLNNDFWKKQEKQHDFSALCILPNTTFEF